jgi:hypothetical protein
MFAKSHVVFSMQNCIDLVEKLLLIFDFIVQSFPRAKKFCNKFFPLFEALGELHDG